MCPPHAGTSFRNFKSPSAPMSALFGLVWLNCCSSRLRARSLCWKRCLLSRWWRLSRACRVLYHPSHNDNWICCCFSVGVDRRLMLSLEKDYEDSRRNILFANTVFSYLSSNLILPTNWRSGLFTIKIWFRIASGNWFLFLYFRNQIAEYSIDFFFEDQLCMWRLWF